MRRFALAFLPFVCAAFAVRPACAATPAPPVVITAQQIALYGDRGLLVADGGVSLRFLATKIDATRASYDLRTNRLSATGSVTVATPSGTLSGTGYVYDFSRKSGILSNAVTVPQFSVNEAVAIAQQAELYPAVSIDFTNAQIRTGTLLAPAASYSYRIPSASAKDFGYSPVPSAALEWPMLLESGADQYTFARVRYDRYNGGAGTGLEEHYARSDRGYAAFSQTMDVDGGRLDLAAYERINDTLSQSLTATSLAGERAFRYALSSSSRTGYVSLSTSQYDAQRSDDLLVQGNQRNLGRAGSLRLQADLGHDEHPGDWPVAQDLRLTPGLHFDTATLHAGPATLSGALDLGESFYDYGRATLASTASLWGNLPVNSHLLWNAGATFSHDAPPFPSTYRTYTLGSVWKASDAFNLVTSLQYTHDYGQYFDYGRPEFSAAFDVRFRRKNGTGYEIGTILPFGHLGDLARQSVLNVRFLR